MQTYVKQQKKHINPLFREGKFENENKKSLVKKNYINFKKNIKIY